MTRTHEIKLDGYGAHTTLAEDRPVMLLGTAESYGIEMLHIAPGKDWAELTITATFNAADGTSTDILMGTDGNIAVPTEATAKSGSGRIVFTGVSNGIQRISCDLDYFVVAHSAINGAQSGGTAPSWFEQAARRFMPLGGTTGQVLTKKTDADFDAEWQDSKGGGLEPLVGTNKTLTPTQVREAFLKGQPIVFSFIDVLGEVAAIFQSFEIYDDIIVASTILPPLIGSQDMGVVLVTGYLSSNVWDLSETLITNPDDIQAAINTALAQAKASGEFDGITPTIGNNGNWFLGDTDTGKPSRGEKGEAGAQGIQGEKGDTGATGATGADGKSAYAYAVDGGYTGTEVEFAAKLAAEGLDKALFVVNATVDFDTMEVSVDKTFEEIKQVYDEGKYSIVLSLMGMTVTPLTALYPGSCIFVGVSLIHSNTATVTVDTIIITKDNVIQNYSDDLALKTDKLPNPYPLTFTGAVNETYDGSSAKTITIPSGGGGLGDFELIGTVDFSQEGMAAASAGVNFEVSDVSEIVLVYNDLVNSTSNNSSVNVYLNKSSKLIESGLHPISGKSGTPLNGWVFIKLLPGVGLTGIQNDGNTSATNYSLDYAKIPRNIIPLASDFRITEIYIRNPPTQYYAVGGTVKVYVR